jgi:hypothetical protein
MKRSAQLACKLALATAASLVAGCGGGSQPKPAPVQVSPIQPLAIATSALPTGFYGEFYSVTLQASGGSGRLTWEISSGALPSGLSLDHNKGIISGIITDASPVAHDFELMVSDFARHVATKQLQLPVSTRAPKILTSTLPDALVNHEYIVQLATTQPSAVVKIDPSSGGLPPGISLRSTQTLAGKPTETGTFPFTLEILDSNNAVTHQRPLAIIVKSSGSRNDATADAAPLSSGTYFASISPFADPVSLEPEGNPDNDYYRLQAQPGAVVSIELFSERNGSPLDTLLEVVDSSGVRLNSCDEPGTSGFTSICFNDNNFEDFTLDSKLLFKVPGSTPMTFFVRVLDWRGDARPDMEYQLQIFGAD